MANKLLKTQELFGEEKVKNKKDIFYINTSF